jgi:hypothetical protein
MSDRSKRNVRDVVIDMESVSSTIKGVREYVRDSIKDAKLISQLDNLADATDKTLEYVKNRIDHADQPKR